jgi:hypothetical protein
VIFIIDVFFDVLQSALQMRVVKTRFFLEAGHRHRVVFIIVRDVLRARKVELVLEEGVGVVLGKALFGLELVVVD